MDFSKLVQDQRHFFNKNKTKDLAFRLAQLRKLKKVLQENEALLYEAIYTDFKKSAFETYAAELGILYVEIDLVLKKLPKWAKRKQKPTNLLNIPAKSYVMPEPLGVSLIMGAWNYPYQLTLLPLVSALAAGNTAILKPSEIPSETSRVMAKLINENFDKNYLHVVEGGIPETTALLKEKFDKIFFTGSTKVGRIIYEAAAKHLTPVTLELGGKSPTIVTATANIEVTAKRIVWAKFLNAGQTCIAPDYIMVEKSIQKALLEALKKQIEEFDYAFENDNYVQIIDDKNFERLTTMINPEKVYLGGQTDAQSRYIAPTILQKITFKDKVMQEEIFGPILPVISYTDIDDMVGQIKARPKPLALYLFTKDSTTKMKVLSEISFGGGAINDAIMHITNHHLPFGGVGDSGIGNYHGKVGFEAFSHQKSIFEKPFGWEPNLKFPPYSLKKLKWIKRFM